MFTHTKASVFSVQGGSIIFNKLFTSLFHLFVPGLDIFFCVQLHNRYLNILPEQKHYTLNHIDLSLKSILQDVLVLFDVNREPVTQPWRQNTLLCLCMLRCLRNTHPDTQTARDRRDWVLIHLMGVSILSKVPEKIGKEQDIIVSFSNVCMYSFMIVPLFCLPAWPCVSFTYSY